MQATISCIIADDDEVDRLTTVSFIRRYSFLKIDGVFRKADEVLSAIPNLNPAVLFMDIDMPGMNGLELRDKLMHIPACIFITSFPEYAVESFERAALDFLVKPIKQDRFEQAMIRLQDYLALREKAALLDITLGGDTLFLKEGHDHIKVQLRDVLYLEALKDYTRIVTAHKKYCVLSSLGNLLTEETFRSFIRVHRSYATQKHYINKISATAVSIPGRELPIGRSYKEQVQRITGGDQRI